MKAPSRWNVSSQCLMQGNISYLNESRFDMADDNNIFEPNVINAGF